jgi:hypothetical protein
MPHSEKVSTAHSDEGLSRAILRYNGSRARCFSGLLVAGGPPEGVQMHHTSIASSVIPFPKPWAIARAIPSDTFVRLEARLGRPVRAIAYPVGRRPALWIRRAAATAGYRIGLTNAGGANHMWRSAIGADLSLDRFSFRRVRTDRSQSDALFLTSHGGTAARRDAPAVDRSGCIPERACPMCSDSRAPRASYKNTMRCDPECLRASRRCGTLFVLKILLGDRRCIGRQ